MKGFKYQITATILLSKANINVSIDIHLFILIQQLKQ